MNILVNFVFIIASVLQLHAGENVDYEAALMQLKEGASDATVKEAYGKLKNGGKRSFPVMLHHLDNVELASARHFQKAVIRRDPVTGKEFVPHPQIGEVAFDLIQGSIEGTWPKVFRRLHILTPENVGSWLEKHENLSLREMKLLAARQTLAKTKKAYEADSNKYTKQDLVFFQQNLDKLSLAGNDSLRKKESRNPFHDF